MTQEEARALLQTIELAAIKTKSNTTEACGDDPQGVALAADLEPNLYIESGRVNLFEAIARIQAKPIIQKDDMFHVLQIADRSSALQAITAIRWNTDLPTSMEFIKSEFEE